MHGVKYTKNEIKKIKTLYNNGESTRSIAKSLGRYHSGVIWHLNNLNIKRRKKSEAAKLGVVKGGIKIFKHSLPKSSKKMSLEKSYILGTLCGDGFLSNKKRAYQICLSVTSKEFFNEFRRCLHEVYGIRTTNEIRISKIKNWNNQYCTRLCSKNACQNLAQYGNFKTKTWNVPYHIKNSSLNIQASFVKGFSDSEGCVDENSRRISLTSINFKGLNEIGGLLRNFGIRYTILGRILLKGNRHDKYDLRIQDRRSIETFYKWINFTINYKKIKLKKIIKNYDVYTTPHREVIKLTPLMVKLRRNGLGCEKIAKRLNIGVVTVWSHLKKGGKL